jgi:hypothetical protein
MSGAGKPAPPAGRAPIGGGAPPKITITKEKLVNKNKILFITFNNYRLVDLESKVLVLIQLEEEVHHDFPMSSTNIYIKTLKFML